MYNIPNKPEKLTFDWLFDRITQEDVYLRYFGFCDLTSKHCNPLRNDQDPDCSFCWNNGVLFFRDFAHKKSYSCVSVVMEIEKLNYHKALEKIYDLFLNSNETVSKIKAVNRPKEAKKYKDIQCKIQPFTIVDIEYLKSYGITKEFTKKAKWYSVKHYWIDGELMYTYNNSNPCIGYYFNGRWKLYFYLNKEWRFLSNTTKDDIQGWNMLPKTGDILVITKAFKDIGTLYEQDIPAIAPQTETSLISQDIINELKNRFKKIYSLMDYDNTGIHLAWTMRELYQIQPLFLTDGLWKRKQGYEGCKDASDIRKRKGFNYLSELAKNYGRI